MVLCTVIGSTTITQLAEKSYSTKDSISMANCQFFIFTVYSGAGTTAIATRTCVTIPGDVFRYGYYQDCSWVNSQNKEAWVGVCYATATSVKVKAGGSDLMSANSYSFSLHGFYHYTDKPN